MGLKSDSRWDDHSQARDAMVAAADPAVAPWHVARPDGKKRARRHIITHPLGQIHFESLPRASFKRPKRTIAQGYRGPDSPF